MNTVKLVKEWEELVLMGHLGTWITVSYLRSKEYSM